MATSTATITTMDHRKESTSGLVRVQNVYHSFKLCPLPPISLEILGHQNYISVLRCVHATPNFVFYCWLSVNSIACFWAPLVPFMSRSRCHPTIFISSLLVLCFLGGFTTCCGVRHTEYCQSLPPYPALSSAPRTPHRMPTAPVGRIAYLTIIICDYFPAVLQLQFLHRWLVYPLSATWWFLRCVWGAPVSGSESLLVPALPAEVHLSVVASHMTKESCLRRSTLLLLNFPRPRFTGPLPIDWCANE